MARIGPLVLVAVLCGCPEEEPRNDAATTTPDAPGYLGLDGACVCDGPLVTMCPPDVPSTVKTCADRIRCEYGLETCCGQSYPATICDCQSGQFVCYATDACLIPSCPDAAN